ncbi:MAG: isocitrate/isopropylmalate dehydrogenase family protein [Methanomassiliicoccales archaeon]|nr:isocitrate/isopropylmalate dehydrogenase family protein [Methanomassiliicoccales archaeon]
MAKATDPAVAAAKEHFGKLVEEQLARLDRMKVSQDWVDFSKKDKVVIGVVGGDGIGPYISRHARRVLEFLLNDELRSGKVEIRDIKGLTIEERVKEMKPIPDGVLAQLKACDVILKGPTTTPKKGDKLPNIESANVAMRRELDLFANVRPVRIPNLGIDWIFFRENTEGSYILGSKGLNVTPDLAFDFCVATTPGCERIIRLGFEHAKRNGIGRVTIVTKANVIKTTDGKFLQVAEKVAKDYPDIKWDDWFIDIMTAKLLDTARRGEFRVIILPNLYGDIITDEAAQIQGGVGTAGSANIGTRYAMFEAIHGSAPRMVDEGRAEYADPSSIIKAASMLLNHIGYAEKAKRLDMAIDVCTLLEKRIVVTGRQSGAKGTELADYLVETMKDPGLSEKWLRLSESSAASG